MALSENQSLDDAEQNKNSAPADFNHPATSVGPNQTGTSGQKQTKTSSINNPIATRLRLKNPLSNFSSYTYNLTFYIVTPECANFFAVNGKLPPNGWYIIARSGGMDSMKDPRALTMDPGGALGPGIPGLDFYIDDLTFDIYMLGADGQKTATAATQFNFKVTEPLGYTFLTKLAKASKQINKITSLLGVPESKHPNLYQQNYMMSVKFYGYDSEGNIIESSKVPDNTSVVMGDKFAVFERVFPLIISKCTFKLDGRSTVYNFEAYINNMQSAFGAKRGKIPTASTIEGTTVKEIIDEGLIPQLNEFQQKAKENKNIEVPIVYEVDWSLAPEIAKSPMVTNEEIDKTSVAGSTATGVAESNVGESQKSNVYNKPKKIVQFAPGTMIVHAIDQIIVKSAYVVERLFKENNPKVEVETQPNPSGVLEWYSVNPVCEVIKRDAITNDWAYKITYQIIPYKIPYIRSQYVAGKSKYYGPVKEYQFLLTGLNTEVINFEMDYNNSFYVVVTNTTTVDDAAKSANQGLVTPAQLGSVNSAATSGSINNKDSIAENVRANLYSVADQAQATIKILGDPDFLMDQIGSKVVIIPEQSRFYSKNLSINPYGGQVFVEIIFDIAEDYKEDTGLLDVDPNQTIAFYPLEQQNVVGSKGLIYKIKKVKSTFSRGKFEQVLEMIMVPSVELIMGDGNPGDAGRPPPQTNGFSDARSMPYDPDTAIPRLPEHDWGSESRRGFEKPLKSNPASDARTALDDSNVGNPSAGTGFDESTIAGTYGVAP